jgi:putative spermidine/putrescine transport system permease protein
VRRFSGALKLYVAIISVFLVAPVAVVIIAAFTSGDFVTFPPKGFSLRWFAKVINDPEFIAPLWNSLRLGVSATAVASILAVPAAIALVRGKIPGRRLIESLMLAPLSLPAIILAVGLLFFTAQIGLGASFLSLLAGHTVIVTPYVLRTVLGVYMSANVETEDAAKVLGADGLRVFWYVTLPIIWPGVLAGGIFAFLMSFDEVAVSILLSNTDTTPLPVSILSYLVYNYDPSVAAIAAIQIAIVVFALAILEIRFGIGNVIFASR